MLNVTEQTELLSYIADEFTLLNKQLTPSRLWLGSWVAGEHEDRWAISAVRLIVHAPS